MLYLSPPDVTQAEIDLVVAALRSGWVAPVGPDIEAFEAQMVAFTGVPNAVALSSGSAAIQLGLRGLGIAPGDEVIVPSVTFAATAFAAIHAGAVPVFIDVEETSWCLDPDLLGDVLDLRHRQGRLPAAIITVDVFGRPCDYGPIMEVADRHGVPVLDDAAEALGATHAGKLVGGFGRAGVFSFNGNKIMTTSGGGMLVTDDAKLAERVRFWSTQSREPFPWYQHEEIGFNFRLSNILAALGRGQLLRLPEMIARRRAIRDRYAVGFAGTDGVEVISDPPWGQSNCWLTTIRFDIQLHAGAPTRAREALWSQGIESRPVWKPLDRQPVFAECETHRTGVADALFESGLCLPSGVAMDDNDVDRVAEIVRSAIGE